MSSSHFCLMINDAPPVQPNTIFKLTARCQPCVSCRGRPLKESLLLSPDFLVQWPIETRMSSCPTYLGPSEQQLCTLDLTNKSTAVYGAVGLGEISLSFQCPTLFSFMRAPGCPDTNDYTLDFSVPQQLTIIVHRLAPKSFLTLRFIMMCSEDAIDHLYQSLTWSYQLALRKRVIEHWNKHTRIIPLFQPIAGHVTDALLISCSATTSAEIQKWSHICNLLHLSKNIWDVERYGGLARDTQHGDQQVHWLNTVKLLIFTTNALSFAPATLMHMHTLIQHFQTTNRGVLFVDCNIREINHALFDYSRPSEKNKIILCTTTTSYASLLSKSL